MIWTGTALVAFLVAVRVVPRFLPKPVQVAPVPSAPALGSFRLGGSEPLPMSAWVRCEGGRLFVVLTNDGPTDRFIARVRSIQFLNDPRDHMVFPISLRWRNHADESREIVSGQDQILEVLRVTWKRNEQNQAEFDNPVLLAHGQEQTLYAMWRSAWRISDRFEIDIEVISSSTGRQKSVPINVHMTADGSSAYVDVCYEHPPTNA